MTLTILRHNGKVMVVPVHIEYLGKGLDPVAGAIRKIQKERGLDVAKGYSKLISLVQSARNRNDLQALRSLHLKPLKGSRREEWSMRPKMSSSWRVILDFLGTKPEGSGADEDAMRIHRLEDYH